MHVEVDLASWLAQHDPLAGVLLTHLHLDHLLGLPDVPRGTPLYAGPGETTPRGPVLFTGDACHTRFGWEHGVEPGTFSLDQPGSETSLMTLEDLARRHPQLEVHLGHQGREPSSVSAAR